MINNPKSFTGRDKVPRRLTRNGEVVRLGQNDVDSATSTLMGLKTTTPATETTDNNSSATATTTTNTTAPRKRVRTRDRRRDTKRLVGGSVCLLLLFFLK